MRYLRRVQKYLLFIGLKDIDDTKKIPVSRYRNKNQEKYANLRIYRFNNFYFEQVLKKKKDFMIFGWFPTHDKAALIEKQALVSDMEDNIRLLIKFTNEEIKLYKEIKDVYQNKEFKDDEKVIIAHFKILKEF